MMESIFDSEIVKAWIHEIRTTGRIREIGMPDLSTRIASGFYDDEPEEAIGENLEAMAEKRGCSTKRQRD